MTELWRRCEKARLVGDWEPEWWCVCHGYGLDTLVPVAAGALLVEDGFEAATERAAQSLADTDLDLTDGRANLSIRERAALAVRAAVGEGDR